MKIALSAFVLCAVYSAHADTIVGFATLKYVEATDYQPGSCESLPQDPTDSRLKCIDFTYWMRYRLINFTDLRGHHLNTELAVMATHLPRRGHWMVVLEELEPKERKAFQAKYRIIDGGWTMDAACLDRPIQTYLPNEDTKPLATDKDNGYCYDLESLTRRHDER